MDYAKARAPAARMVTNGRTGHGQGAGGANVPNVRSGHGAFEAHDTAVRKSSNVLAEAAGSTAGKSLASDSPDGIMTDRGV